MQVLLFTLLLIASSHALDLSLLQVSAVNIVHTNGQAILSLVNDQLYPQTYALSLPSSDGDPGSVLMTDGNGVTQWANPWKSCENTAAGTNYADATPLACGFNKVSGGDGGVRLPTVGFSGYTVKNSINATVVVYPQFTYGLIDQTSSFVLAPFTVKTFSLIDGTQDEWESF